jgi:rhodanese-related sulfurtransferase
MSDGREDGGIPRWNADQLRTQRARGGDLVVLDVRTLDARMQQPCEIPGARWLPLADVARGTGELSRDATIITYCT